MNEHPSPNVNAIRDNNKARLPENVEVVRRRHGTHLAIKIECKTDDMWNVCNQWSPSRRSHGEFSSQPQTDS